MPRVVLEVFLYGHAPTRLVLGGAEEGSALRHAGVGDEELTPGTQAAVKQFRSKQLFPFII